MKNAEWMLRNGYKFINLLAFDADNANIAYKIGLRMEDYTWKWVGKVTKLYNDKSTAVLVLLDSEHVESILDDTENRYLSAVIKPFRKHIENISKHRTANVEYILLEYKHANGGLDFFHLPQFKAGTMYKGMETNRKYTLEELGL